jgi:hypothetical protein
MPNDRSRKLDRPDLPQSGEQVVEPVSLMLSSIENCQVNNGVVAVANEYVVLEQFAVLSRKSPLLRRSPWQADGERRAFLRC